MTATLVSNPITEPESNSGVELGVARWVMERLGEPTGLLKVEVKKLWGQNFRVNIFTATPTDRALPLVNIPDSFFVTASAEGFSSRPVIEKKYSSAPAVGV